MREEGTSETRALRAPGLADLEERLARHVAGDDPATVPARRSAVAAVVRRVGPAPEILLMTRIEHAADPWSGQVSLPGGRRALGDADLLATAVRETREEVGLDLGAHARLLTRLAPVSAVARGTILPMDITPWVFRLERDAPLVPGAEAREAFWLPLDRVVAGALDARHVYVGERGPREMPAWNFEGRVIWGLTHRMIGELLRAAGARA